MMIYRIAASMALLLIVKASMSQHGPQTYPSGTSANNFNEAFDKVITSDRTIPVVEYNGTLLRPRRKPPGNVLVFDPEINSISESIRTRTNESRYPVQARIQFLKDVIAWKGEDALRNIEDHPSDFIATNPEALQLIKDYFLKNPKEHYQTPQNRWLEFQVVNSMPGYIDVIEEYINRRDTLKAVFSGEGMLAYRLIIASREKKAFELMQIHTADWLAGKIKYLYHGDRENNANIFDLFCFSQNNEIRTEARKLLWQCLERDWNEDLHVLALYLDENRAVELKDKQPVKKKRSVQAAYGTDKRIFNGPQVVTDLKQFGLGNFPPVPDLPDYWQFAVWRKGYDDNMQKIFTKSKFVRRPSLITSSYPADYQKLSWIWFEPIMERIGIYDIEVQEKVEKLDSVFVYKLFISSNEATYKLEFTVAEPECQVEHMQRVVKVINLLLMKKGVKERWVEVATGENFRLFGLFEPAKLKPFFNKYGTSCFALYKGDAFDQLK
jgi:hypothetical protein